MKAITLEEIAARLRTLGRGKLFIATFITECNAQDMMPVVHGRWVSYPHQIDRECSICGHTEPYKFADKDAEIFNFCPHCGADMREVINVLIDAPDKDKPFIIECRKDTFDNIDTEWGQAEISRIVNCGWGSVAEVKEPN